MIRQKKFVLILTILPLIVLGLIIQNNDDSFLKKNDSGNIAFAEKIIETCKEDLHCAVDKLNELDKKTNRDSTLAIFSDVVKLYDESKYLCHETSHHLGLWIYGYTNNLDEALKYAEMICGGGLYHGIFQNYFMTLKFENVLKQDIDITNLCPTQYTSQSIERWQCIHGIGHGLVDLYDYDVLDAVKRCDKFMPGLDQISCSKGIFMQNNVHYLETGDGDFNEDDIYYPCNQINLKYAPACFHYQSTYILKQNDTYVLKSFDICDDAPTEFVSYCYYGMGRQMSSEIKGNIENAIYLCELGTNSQFHPDCLRGMLLTLVNHNTDPTVGFWFCSGLPDKYKETCYDGLGQWIIMLDSSNDARLSQCELAGQYRDICMNANLENLELL